MMATKTPQETGLLKVSSSNALTKFAQNLGVTSPPQKKNIIIIITLLTRSEASNCARHI